MTEFAGAPEPTRPPGVVIRSTGLQYRVRLPSGEIHTATIRGRFRLEDLDSTNPIAVGDQVLLDLEGDSPVVSHILPRHNYILRRSTHNAHQRQILVANVDQAIFVYTIEQPFTPLGSLDRFLVMCEAYHVPAVILFNKVDVVKQKQKHLDKLADFRAIYEDAGYRQLALSALNPDNATRIRDLLAGKVSFLAGPSGAGKSTLVNLADPSLNLRTRPLNKAQKGQHTTTFAEMHPLTFGGYVVDAPGFREFGVFDIRPEELSHYYPEMRHRLHRCRFNNCLHANEPDCAVVQAVREGEIPESRYNTYLGILDSLPKPDY